MEVPILILSRLISNDNLKNKKVHFTTTLKPKLTQHSPVNYARCAQFDGIFKYSFCFFICNWFGLSSKTL